MKLLETLLCCGAFLAGSVHSAESREAFRYDWPLFTCNFGGLDEFAKELGGVGFPQHAGDQVLLIQMEAAVGKNSRQKTDPILTPAANP